MLDGELERQKQLKAQLSADPEASAWLDEPHVFQNYKQLQFVDTLALYFNRTHPSERGEMTFEHVPASAAEDVSVTIRPRGEGDLCAVALSVRRRSRVRLCGPAYRTAAER